VGRYLEMQGATIARHRFATFEGRGENFAVEVGEGDRVLVLIAHHDAVPGSPGANDNAAAVGILLHLLARYRREPPRGLRLRFLFTACEELGYLGARAYVREMAVERCGIGDGLVLWDVAEETPFLRHVRAGLEGLGLQADDTYHVVGRIPVFGSDHRAFAAAGLPAYGLSIIPSHHLDGLRQFVLSPVRSAAIHLVRRPPPFDTYHTSGDNLATLDPRALDRVVDALVGIVHAVEEGG
jgi:Zn-dependent M28 family amino/carboxypeptidase